MRCAKVNTRAIAARESDIVTTCLPDVTSKDRVPFSAPVLAGGTLRIACDRNMLLKYRTASVHYSPHSNNDAPLAMAVMMNV